MINFYEEYKKLDALAKARLKKELEKRGCEYEFADGEEPVVAAHPLDYTADYIILKAFVNLKYDVPCMIGREVECDELVDLSCEDIEGAHIHYIWEYIDDINEPNK